MPEPKILTLPAVLSVKQLADALDQPVTAVMSKLIGFGVLATINEDIDFDTAAIVADDFGVQVERQESVAGASREIKQIEGAQLELRPPVVTIMGHVDHGKTTLLDTIRKTNVAAKEAGGITQHISSYQIEIIPKATGDKRIITFLDTPGHSAFEAMRRHGAQITDLVVLVVAADDGVKPQTIEAINHARAMKVPIMVAINKIDKPDADLDRVKGELAEHDLVPEEWGGSTVVVPVSATQGTGIPDLLEMVFLATDLRSLQANYHVPAVGVVIESHLQPGIGPVATVLVQNGILKVGDFVVFGDVSGKVRTLTDYKGKKIQLASASMPVEISGLSGVPQFGEQLVVVNTEKDAKESARQHLRNQTAKRATSALASSAQGATQKEGKKTILHVIVKADTKGSLEAVLDTLNTYRNEDVEVRVVANGVGDIGENDITMAQASKALVVGFQVRLPAVIKSFADREKVAVSLYSVVYELFDSIRTVLADLMPEEVVERQVAELKVLARFRDNRKNVVAGGLVQEGTLAVKAPVRVMRNKEVVAEGKVVTLRRGKSEVKEVHAGSECGFELELGEGGEKLAVNDMLVSYAQEKVKKPLGM